ncbi:MAG: OadG family protein [Treponema sp.]|nr:OadG family protein [Treponema sp.]
MTIIEMLGQSGLLTLLGMCVVFGFIIILIACMKLLQVVIHALKLDKEEPAAPANKAAAQDNNAVVAAIAAAVHDKVLKS